MQNTCTGIVAIARWLASSRYSVIPWVYDLDGVLKSLEDSIQLLPIRLADAIRLLEMARRLAVRGALSAAKSAQIVDMTVNSQISLAWQYEETLQLAIMLQKLSLNEMPEPPGLHIFKLLKDERTRLRGLPLAARTPRILKSTKDLTSEPTLLSTLDVLLVIGEEVNEIPLKSLLANRRCALRIHLLYQASSINHWVEEVIDAAGITDISVHNHQPEWAAAAVCDYTFRTAEASSRCDITYARLVPELWLSGVQKLVVLDFSSSEVGPLILGDICELPGIAGNVPGERPGFLWAAKYEEETRWSRQSWSAAVMLMDLEVKSQFSVDSLFSIIPDVHTVQEELARGIYQGNFAQKYTQFWLNYIGTNLMGVLRTLPNSWYFVPYEPWLFEIAWESLNYYTYLTRHVIKWKWIFEMREYPGFDLHSLRIACPPLVMHLPVAMLSLSGIRGPDEIIAHHLRDELYSWRARDNCHKPVHIMGLRWAWAAQTPRYPYKVQDSPWVRELLATYAAL